VLAGIAAVAGAVFFTVLNPLETDSIAQQADAYLSRMLELEQFNGTVLIAKGGKVILKKGYGFANHEWAMQNTAQTKFRIGSLTKQFTATAILQLHEQGLLDVNDFLSEYIPDYPEGDRITLHHLLTHTSGIFNMTNIEDFQAYAYTVEPLPIEEVIEFFKHLPLDFDPGSTFSYSNSGYVLLGYIIEKVSGRNYGEYLRENIFDTVGMNDSGVDSNQSLIAKRAAGYSRSETNMLINAPYIDMSVPHAAGALYSTVEDLYRWDRSLYGTLVLSGASLSIMFTPFLSNYAYGWGISERFGRKRISHSGGINGFLSNIARYVEDDIVIIVLSNFIFTPLGDISRNLAAITFGQPYEMP
jgi:CubicO group peptidase (beta-lactamase class C family)